MIEPMMKIPPADSKAEVTEKYTQAFNLNVKILISANMAQQNLYEMCKGLKEMRDDKLYKELGYTNFGDYCETETGIKRSQAYNYITICEKLPSDFVHSSGQIGVKKLYLLSTLSDEERTEITETTDLETTTVKELEAKIEKLQIEADKAKMLSHMLDDTNKICKTISKQRDNAENKAKKLEADVNALESAVKELESRPIDVAVSEPSHEVENMMKALKTCDNQWAEKYNKLEEDNIIFVRGIHQDYQAKMEQAEQEHKAQLEKLTAEYEQKLSENQSEPDPKEKLKQNLKVYYISAFNAFETLVKFANKQTEDDKKFCIEQIEKLVNAISQTVKEG